MCGRFALATEKHILEMLYDLEIRPDFDLTPRYNIAPTQNALALRLFPENEERELVDLKWGLVPFWSGDSKIAARMINARSETVAEKPAFRDAFKKRRLLIPASGFYEWRKEERGKQPYFIGRRDGRTFSLAGLWERWDKGGDPLETFAIITTAANKSLSELHDRMPVIISHADYPLWLNPETDISVLAKMMLPNSDEDLSYHPVSREVNKPFTEGALLIEPQKID